MVHAIERVRANAMINTFSIFRFHLIVLAFGNLVLKIPSIIVDVDNYSNVSP